MKNIINVSAIAVFLVFSLIGCGGDGGGSESGCDEDKNETSISAETETEAETEAETGISFGINIPDEGIAKGEYFSVELSIRGLGNETAPSLGAFSLNLDYDPAMIEFVSIDYSSHLGYLNLQEVDTHQNDNPGSLYIDAVSFVRTEETNDTQPDNFVLATVTFVALERGEGSLTVSNILLSDTGAIQIFVD